MNKMEPPSNRHVQLAFHLVMKSLNQVIAPGPVDRTKVWESLKETLDILRMLGAQDAMSYDELSKALGVSKPSLERWQSGARHPHPLIVPRLQELLEPYEGRVPQWVNDAFARSLATLVPTLDRAG